VYEYRCAITGLTVLLEAAHIKPVSEGGSDHIRNGILFHKAVHAAFDSFLFTIGPDFLTVIRPEGMPLKIHVPYLGWHLWSPLNEDHRPSRDMILWHNEAAKKFWADYCKGATHANN
jgi:putative restriction endonuclease